MSRNTSPSYSQTHLKPLITFTLHFIDCLAWCSARNTQWPWLMGRAGKQTKHGDAGETSRVPVPPGNWGLSFSTLIRDYQGGFAYHSATIHNHILWKYYVFFFFRWMMTTFFFNPFNSNIGITNHLSFFFFTTIWRNSYSQVGAAVSWNRHHITVNAKKFQMDANLT